MTAIPPETVETLLHARWVLGTDDEQPLLEDHCLVLDKGRVAADGLPERALSADTVMPVWGIAARWLGDPGRRALVTG